MRTYYVSSNRAMVSQVNIDKKTIDKALYYAHKALKDIKRKESTIGSSSYDKAASRAFNLAKTRIFFNPDMINFITLTYSGTQLTPEQVLEDVKTMIKTQKRYNQKYSQLNHQEKITNYNNLKNKVMQKEARKLRERRTKELTQKQKNWLERVEDNSKLPVHSLEGSNALPFEPEPVCKYIFVLEYQKRGSIHVHMICNNFFGTYKNQNEYDSLLFWNHGYSSMLKIQDFDENFKPYLYLFKYLRKSQRIGKSFVHSSRNLDNYAKFDDNHKLRTKLDFLYDEAREFYIEDKLIKHERRYYGTTSNR